MINVNDCLLLNRSDNEAFDYAIANRGADGIVVVPPRKGKDGRDFWLLDRAILLPSNTTVQLQGCKLKLSDSCRDNFFRSANCGLGIDENETLYNIHIKGEGFVVLEGADHPRASGDATKMIKNPCPYNVDDICRLADWVPEERRIPEEITFGDRHKFSYGTDAGKEGESQYGDWRGIGILFACVERFCITGLIIRESHGWGISLEACAKGRIEHIEFDARMNKRIDGILQNIENQDGIDLRNGCHDILINDITGETGDDVVALSAIAVRAKAYIPGGSLRSTHVMHNDWTRRDPDIYNIIIRNIRAYSSLCFLVRLLPCECCIHDIIIDGVMDTSPSPDLMWGGILLGEADTIYGRNLPGSLRNITISNVICNNINKVIIVDGYLEDSVITNIVGMNSKCSPVAYARKGGLKNVYISNVARPEGKPEIEG